MHNSVTAKLIGVAKRRRYTHVLCMQLPTFSRGRSADGARTTREHGAASHLPLKRLTQPNLTAMLMFVPDAEPPEVRPSRFGQPSFAQWGTAFLTSTLLCLTGPCAQAQAECAAERDEFDPFTKSRTLCVAPTSKMAGPFYRWTAVNADMSLELTWQQPGEHANVVLEGYPLMLMLENDSIITLPSITTVTGMHDRDSLGRERTSGTYQYAVTTEKASMLRQFWIKRVRIYFYEGYQEFQADKAPAWQHTMARTAACFLEQCEKGIRPKPVLVGRTAEGTPTSGSTRMR
jgi:hypothetical protein